MENFHFGEKKTTHSLFLLLHKAVEPAKISFGPNI